MSDTLPPLPPIGDLSEQQVRGTACVFCGVTLDNGDAVNLGERTVRQAGVLRRWFPRACRQDGST